MRRHTLFLAAPVVAAAALAGSALTKLLAPAPVDPPLHPHANLPPPRTPPDGTAIVARNLFSSRRARLPDRDHRHTRPTSLPFELVSTMVVPTDERWSTAVIRDLATTDPALYRRGSRLSHATITRIIERRVYLTVEDHLEYLDFSPKPEPEPQPEPAKSLLCSTTPCTLDRSLLDRTLADPSALASSIRAIPTPNGLRLDFVRPGSLLANLGLHSGDLLRSINHLEGTSPDQWLTIYTRLRHATHLTLALDRRGAPLTLDFLIR